MNIIKGEGFEIRHAAFGDDDWRETITLLPKKGFPRQLAIRRAYRYGSIDYGGTLYPANRKNHTMLAYAGSTELEEVRVEKTLYSQSWSIWFQRTAFEVSEEEARILSFWLYPGPPLPAGWVTVKGISGPAPAPVPAVDAPIYFEVPHSATRASAR